MTIQPKTPGIHHIALRCLDFALTKAFYQDLLGFPMVLETPELMGCLIGPVFVGFKQAAPVYPADTTFTPFNIGLDHIAMAYEDAAELHRVAALQAASVENTGVKTDAALQKDYVAFKDPDRISWEF
ncbi:VOC family protein [Hymenobacter sp. PAMC 26628]|uniref:VOC family protein n=1 Tax=Hymenobacter sp. PAMC 26628 TaxID=1484118 RepID=UPI0007700586|nr:VOC family protein [Hymenobacter sp. PAMC 26628]AMJ65116.1 bleomycin resistance protein [Hymenobacter sp. PAMC 26628]